MEDSSVDLAQEARDLQHLSVSIAKLQEMHSQLRGLRDAVPSLVRPMRGPSTPPEIVYADFVKAAKKAVGDTKDFTIAMKTKTNQDVLSEARASKLGNPAGIVAWLATQQEDWPQKPLAVGMNKNHDGFGVQGYESTGALGRDEALETFKASHPETAVHITVDEQEIVYTLPYAGLLFRIRTSVEDAQKPIYNVVCQNSSDPSTQSKLYPEITGLLAARPKQFDLVYTLEILTSYSDLTSRSCSKCNRVIDADGRFPTHRQPDFGDSADRFQAFHEGCLPT